MTRVLVTGAGGFLGSRLADHLEKDGCEVVLNVRTTAGAAPHARFGRPVEVGDVAIPGYVGKLSKGASAIVHCATGDALDETSAMNAILEQAGQQRVPTFVHISTAEVYAAQRGVIGETSSLLSPGSGYAGRKALSDAAVMGASARFRSMIVLRPSIIYGPQCPAWTVRPLLRLLSGWRPTKSEMSGTCNPVHVDDLAALIASLVERPLDGLNVFNVVGPDRPTWWEFHQQMLDRMDRGVDRAATAPTPGLLSSVAMNVARALPARTAKRILGFARSQRALAVMAGKMSRLNAATPTSEEAEVFQREAVYSTARLERAGLARSITLAKGMDQTMRWAQTMGLAGRRVSSKDIDTDLRAGEGA